MVHQVSEAHLQLTAAKVELEKAVRLSKVVEEQMIVTSLETIMPTLVVQVVDEAVLPKEVVSPRPVESSLSALLFGLLGGGLLVLLTEWINPRIRSAESVALLLGYPPISTLSVARLESKDAPSVLTMLSRRSGVTAFCPVDGLSSTQRALDLLLAHGAAEDFRGVPQITGNASGLECAASMSGIVLIVTGHQTSQEVLVRTVADLVEATGSHPDIILVT